MHYVDRLSQVWVYSGAAWQPAGGLSSANVTNTASIQLSVTANVLSATVVNSYITGLFSASLPISITSGAISIAQANNTTNGYISSSDWNIFNSKQNALTFGTISTSTTGVTITNGANATVGPAVGVNIATAAAGVTGLLTGSDWSTFNAKQAALTFGNLTSPTTGVSVTGGTGAVIGGGVAVSIQTANGSQPGLLASADWTTFNNKQAALGFTPENSANKGVANGYAGLDSGGKAPVAQLPSTIMEYRGAWDVAANSPTLADGTGANGDVG